MSQPMVLPLKEPRTHLITPVTGAPQEPEYEALHQIACAWGAKYDDGLTPFLNTGYVYDGVLFRAHAYDWREGWKVPDQLWNFLWRDVAFRWYKHYSRILFISRRLTPDEISELLVECLAEIEQLPSGNPARSEPEYS